MKDGKVRLTMRARAKGLSTLEFEGSMLDVPHTSQRGSTERHRALQAYEDVHACCIPSLRRSDKKSHTLRTEEVCSQTRRHQPYLTEVGAESPGQALTLLSEDGPNFISRALSETLPRSLGNQRRLGAELFHKKLTVISRNRYIVVVGCY